MTSTQHAVLVEGTGDMVELRRAKPMAGYNSLGQLLLDQPGRHRTGASGPNRAQVSV